MDPAPAAALAERRDRAKRNAALRALALVKPGMVLGLGTGSTAEHFLRLLAARHAEGLDIVGVPTSRRTETFARALGLPLRELGAVARVDLTVDGADEIDPERRLIKGGGGALLGEKIVAAASARMVVIAEAEKQVPVLGAFPLPVEVVGFGWEVTARRIAESAAAFVSEPARLTLRRAGEAPYRTDAGHLILDCAFGPIHDPEGLAHCLDRLPGVVEHGLFLGMAEAVLLGRADGVDVLGTL